MWVSYGRSFLSEYVRKLHILTIRNQSQQSPANFIRIVEVGPRDGLQNEPNLVPTDVKIEFINKLSQTGLQSIEVTSFVSPKWVPQMADNHKVFSGIQRKHGVSYPVLVPNLKGLETALKVEGIDEIAVFASASDGFSRKNVNCSADGALQRIKFVILEAKKHNLKVRGYISCVVGCPYDGYIHPSAVSRITCKLLEFGCYEISLGDTIGVGTRRTLSSMIEDVLKFAKADSLAIHCHDTYGQALVNICTALEYGISVVDSAASGLGGCPFAKGATGNAATEDVVYMLHGLGCQTGVDMAKLVEAGHFISSQIGKPTASRANRALYQKLYMK